MKKKLPNLYDLAALLKYTQGFYLSDFFLSLKNFRPMSAAPAAINAEIPPSIGTPTGPPPPSGGSKGGPNTFWVINNAPMRKMVVRMILCFMIQ